VRWQDRAHFFAVSARLMRRILGGFCPSRHYQKRGAGAGRCRLTRTWTWASRDAPTWWALDDALETLAGAESSQEQVSS